MLIQRPLFEKKSWRLYSCQQDRVRETMFLMLEHFERLTFNLVEETSLGFIKFPPMFYYEHIQ